MSRKKASLFVAILTITALFLAGITAPKQARIVQEIEPTRVQNTPAPSPRAQTDVLGQIDAGQPEQSVGTIKVVRAIDGDTIELEDGRRLRYIGVDTPELGGSGNSSECFARSAFDRNRALVVNKFVTLETDVSETDRYGRMLRYVYVGETMINEQLVKEGYANASSYPPDVKYQDRLRAAEQLARTNGSGLWSSCSSPNTFPPPPEQTTQPNPSTFSCDCNKSCSAISSCAEAQFQLTSCGCSARDGDGDGRACDGAPLNCEN